MSNRGVQVWFQNRRAKEKAKLAKARKNGSTASSPSESEKNSGSNNNDSSNESTSESVNNKKESSDSLTDKTVSSPSSTGKDIKDETKNSLDLENKIKLGKDYFNNCLLNNPYIQVDDDTNQGMLPFTPNGPDCLYQGFGPTSLHTDIYGTPINLDRRGSLPNIFPLRMYGAQQQPLANPLKPLPFQGLHQHPQLQTQAQPYSLIGGQKSASGSYSPQSLQFLRPKSPYSSNSLLYSQKVPSMGPSTDSTSSSPSLGSEKGSQPRLPSGLAKHPDHIFYGGIDGAGINRNRYVNFITSPGLGDNISSPHSSSGNYSPSYPGFISDVSINGLRSLDDSFYNPYSLSQQALPYASNIQNFVTDLNGGVLQGLPSYPSGFNPARRSSCPPEFLTSVNSLPLSLDDNLTKQQKGLETIKEDEGIE